MADDDERRGPGDPDGGRPPPPAPISELRFPTVPGVGATEGAAPIAERPAAPVVAPSPAADVAPSSGVPTPRALASFRDPLASAPEALEEIDAAEVPEAPEELEELSADDVAPAPPELAQDSSPRRATELGAGEGAAPEPAEPFFAYAPTERMEEPAVLPPAAVQSSRPAKEATPDAAQLQSWVVMLLMAASLVMVLWNMQTRSIENANTGSRYATIESLVERGTYDIDASKYSRTPDKVRARNHWVSSKPPLLPTYGAGIYWVVKSITGYTISEHEGVIVWTVGMFTGWLSHLAFLVFFYKLCCLLLKRQLAILVTVAGACFAYLGVAYATAINNHSVGATFQVVGFYFAYRAGREPRRPGSWILAGAILGILPAMDLPSLALTGFTGIYLLTKDWKRALLLFGPALLPGLALQLLLAHKATGSWLPAYADASLKSYAGNLFRSAKTGIEALREPKPLYAFHMLLGHHGLFSMTPLYFFGLFEFVRRLVKREPHRAEIGVWMATLAAFLAFYIRSTTNYGGWCVGMRWFVPVMPWLLLLFGMWLDRTKINRWKQLGVLFAFVVSAYNVQDGLSSPFQFSVWHNLIDGTPNRNRLGPTWNLSRLGPKPPGKPKKGGPPKPAPPPPKKP